MLSGDGDDNNNDQMRCGNNNSTHRAKTNTFDVFLSSDT